MNFFDICRKSPETFRESFSIREGVPDFSREETNFLKIHKHFKVEDFFSTKKQKVFDLSSWVVKFLSLLFFLPPSLSHFDFCYLFPSLLVSSYLFLPLSFFVSCFLFPSLLVSCYLFLPLSLCLVQSLSPSLSLGIFLSLFLSHSLSFFCSLTFFFSLSVCL